jgi:ATP-dependent RNA helicase SUPV3L1/SUV3
MGLNLDLERIAFASLSKFDGFEQRALAVEELGQIAGRAGRHVRDGQFGTLTSAPALDARVVSAIEGHRFPAIARLVWRSVELDFETPRALLDSLSVAPGRELFTRVERADDFEALKALASDGEVAGLATDREGVALLWEVCRLPDFGKGLLGEHVRIVKDVFLQLAEGQGRLSEDWLNQKVAPLDDLKGDLHALTARLEAIRTWTYISHRSAWVSDAAHWQHKTRAIEDALGDALHQRCLRRAARSPSSPASSRPG